MPQRSPPPAESDLLCESCGYILNGLDPSKMRDALCPECGAPLADSVDPARRGLAPIERHWSPQTFWETTYRAIAAKRLFYRTLVTRRDTPAVARFGRLHRYVAGTLFGIAGAFHAAYLAEQRGWVNRWGWTDFAWIAVVAIVFAALAGPMLSWLTRIAAFLTTTESRFWGMRLPPAVVARAMNFHAANYLPLAITALAVTAGYRIGTVTGLLSKEDGGTSYLWTLCGLVVVGAVWLFESYVVAMRRIRLANF